MASFEVEKGQATLILNVDKMQLAQILLHSFSFSQDCPSIRHPGTLVCAEATQKILVYFSSGSQIIVEAAS